MLPKILDWTGIPAPVMQRFIFQHKGAFFLQIAGDFFCVAFISPDYLNFESVTQPG
jgi:hypothetical protein